ncbi:helix-turn-helix domain-containing protein [Leptospira levettii]|uniref:helix-turn-helix domain-containing protein n=1 Tax=Leptospira levettii TaxID=2023178 RepID=UPI00223CCC48|nr:helix-turn-helix domain-containing protein [Leptospira levettii]MCW7475544.1 helix-turn-helix domain-containing protein [Leptospira levettii]
MRTGLWIPVEIEALPLNLSEKVLLAEIVSLDRVGECFASNEHFSKLLGVRPDSASRMISKLKKMGYIKQSGFDGRRRKLLPIFLTKTQEKDKAISNEISAHTPKEKMEAGKYRVGASAEAGFAISNEPIKRVQSQYNVQKSWDEFLEWCQGKVSPSTWDHIIMAKKPDNLNSKASIFWKMWAPL